MKYLIVLAVILTSCGGAKHATKQALNKDSIAVVELSSSLTEALKERNFYQRKVEELEYLAITFAECPAAVNLDSLKAALTSSGCRPEDIAALQGRLAAVQSKFERAADGSIKAEGRLASVTVSNKKLVDSLHERNAEVIRLKSELAVSKTQVRTEVKTKEVEKKGVNWLWFFFGAAVGAGAMLGALKIIGKV